MDGRLEPRRSSLGNEAPPKLLMKRRRSVMQLDIEAAKTEGSAMEGVRAVGFLGALLNAKKAHQDIGETLAQESLKQKSGSVKTRGLEINARSIRLVTQQDAAMRRIDIINACLASVSLVLMVIQVNLAWSEDENKVVSNTANTICKLCQTLVTVALLGGIGRYYVLLVKFMALETRLDRGMIWTSRLILVPLFFECVVCLLHVPPFFETSIDEKANVIVLVRGYLYIRVIRDITPFYVKRNALVKQGFRSLLVSKFDWRLSLRTWFYLRSTAFTVLSGMAAGGVCAFALWVFEREARPDVMNGSNTAWLVTLTMSTVGYGQLIPQLEVGKIATVFAGAIGVLVASLFVGVVANDLFLPKQSEMAINWYYRNLAYTRESHFAALTVQCVWRHKVQRRLTQEQHDLQRARLRRKFLTWRRIRLRWELAASDPVLDQCYVLQEQFEMLNDDLVIDIEVIHDELFTKLEGMMMVFERYSRVLDVLEAEEAQRRRADERHQEYRRSGSFWR